MGRASYCNTDSYAPKSSRLSGTIHVSKETLRYGKRPTGWRRPIRCLISCITFRKLATNCRALLRKTTYNEKASYESSPPCTREKCLFGTRPTDSFASDRSVFIYMYICTCINIYICTYINIYMYVYIHVYTVRSIAMSHSPDVMESCLPCESREHLFICECDVCRMSRESSYSYVTESCRTRVESNHTSCVLCARMIATGILVYCVRRLQGGKNSENPLSC